MMLTMPNKSDLDGKRRAHHSLSRHCGTNSGVCLLLSSSAGTSLSAAHFYLRPRMAKVRRKNYFQENFRSAQRDGMHKPKTFVFD
jgi:hypothetical protein